MFLIPIFKNFRRWLRVQVLLAYHRILSQLFHRYPRHPLRLKIWHRRRKITLVLPGLWFKYTGTIKKIVFYYCIIVLLIYAVIL